MSVFVYCVLILLARMRTIWYNILKYPLVSVAFYDSVKRDASFNQTDTLESNTSYESSRSDDAKFEIAADIHFLDKMRQKPPTLVYFKRESDIERLVEMRMKPGNPIKSKDYHFQCSSSAGMSEKVAAKLDGILQQLKCSGTATISSEVQRENRTELNYHIEFWLRRIVNCITIVTGFSQNRTQYLNHKSAVIIS